MDNNGIKQTRPSAEEVTGEPEKWDVVFFQAENGDLKRKNESGNRHWINKSKVEDLTNSFGKWRYS